MNNILIEWPSDLDGHLHYCVGLSGGIDSVVLIHLLNQLQKIKVFTLSAIHVNHNLSPNANLWQTFCEKLCQKWSIPLRIANISVQKIGGEGLENTARMLRYQEYTKSGADVMVLAHHQDDLIETMLSQICRGSDIHNIAAMHPLTIKRQQLIWRPLLSAPKQVLQDYAQEHQLTHIDDESNRDNRYLRNFIRNKIIPPLTKFENSIITKLQKSLDNLQQATDLIDEIAASDLNSCELPSLQSEFNNKSDMTTETKEIQQQLVLANYRALSASRQLNLLSYFIRKHNLPLPSNKQLKEFNRQLLTARPDRTPSLFLSDNKEIKLVKQLIIIG